jgi:hypothetical protein
MSRMSPGAGFVRAFYGLPKRYVSPLVLLDSKSFRLYLSGRMTWKKSATRPKENGAE